MAGRDTRTTHIDYLPGLTLGKHGLKALRQLIGG